MVGNKVGNIMLADMLRELMVRLDAIAEGKEPEQKDIKEKKVEEDDETGAFSPPLQLKIEMLKKNAGLPSAIDDELHDD
jgi:hypothetical protein